MSENKRLSQKVKVSFILSLAPGDFIMATKLSWQQKENGFISIKMENRHLITTDL